MSTSKILGRQSRWQLAAAVALITALSTARTVVAEVVSIADFDVPGGRTFFLPEPDPDIIAGETLELIIADAFWTSLAPAGPVPGESFVLTDFDVTGQRQISDVIEIFNSSLNGLGTLVLKQANAVDFLAGAGRVGGGAA